MTTTNTPIFYEDSNYLIRPALSTAEFRNVWWGFMQVLGWNRGYYDLDTYMNPSNGYGMILLIHKASQEPVGHVAAVINERTKGVSTGWISMFIVDEQHRGQKLGRELFKAAERDFEEKGVEIRGLDGVVEQRETYERRNFVSSPLGTIRIMIRSLVAKAPIQEAAKLPLPPGTRIVEIREVPRALLAEHELKYTGFDRPKLWSDEHLFDRQDVEGIAIVSNAGLRTVDDVKAWAINRRCSGGIRIGPVYADGPDLAQAVLAAAMSLGTPQKIQVVPLPNEAMNEWPAAQVVDNATLVAEVWGGNDDAVKLFDRFGWKPAGVEYYRMWVDGKAPIEQSEGGLAQKGVYAIFDAAVG